MIFSTKFLVANAALFAGLAHGLPTSWLLSVDSENTTDSVNSTTVSVTQSSTPQATNAAEPHFAAVNLTRFRNDTDFHGFEDHADNFNNTTKPTFISHLHHPDNHTEHGNLTLHRGDFHHANNTLGRRACAYTGDKIHIMPVGGSLSSGSPAESSDDEMWAYRQQLIKHMGNSRTPISFVGSQHRGTGHNLQTYEGWDSAVISEVHQKMLADLAYTTPAPRGLVVTVGTQDVLVSTSSNNYLDAPNRMDSMLSDIFKSNENLVVILSAVPHIKDSSKNERAKWLNLQYSGLVDKYYNAGRHILYSDVSGTLGDDDLFDDSNPTKAGYIKLGDVYGDSLDQAFCNGWFN